MNFNFIQRIIKILFDNNKTNRVGGSPIQTANERRSRQSSRICNVNRRLCTIPTRGETNIYEIYYSSTFSHHFIHCDIDDDDDRRRRVTICSAQVFTTLVWTEVLKTVNVSLFKTVFRRTVPVPVSLVMFSVVNISFYAFFSVEKFCNNV